MKVDNVVIVLDAKEIIKKIEAKYGKHPILSSTYDSVKKRNELIAQKNIL
jgi:TRAP-type uncharacterized transport system substrate-binding protein